MFKVTTNSKYDSEERGKSNRVHKTVSNIPFKYRPYLLSVVYTLLIVGFALLLNGTLEVTFNQTVGFKEPFYFTVLFMIVLSLLLPYSIPDKTLAVHKVNMDGFQVEQVVLESKHKNSRLLIIGAKILTLVFSISLFLSSYTSNKGVEKYERITIHNVPIKGVDSVQIAIRMSRNTRDSATPGRFKQASEASISEKQTYVYEEYTYGFPYQLLKPIKRRDMEEGKKYLDGKRAKIQVKWYGDAIHPRDVKGKINTIFNSEAMNDLLLESFGVEAESNNAR
ncbi:hypothetical protein [Flammeovirga sp. SJP92]|uniref:hypothetical protein n=1 Tax=Flammeovirga sp. SJP92 TaxID=1775430 RepID=UPI0007895171|nr:hypothetical protein [Flammeovirga sp. SJP92]KXX71571.1 hypothetical protein AVL50_04675 [Flammeovirga sp. SJP92]